VNNFRHDCRCQRRFAPIYSHRVGTVHSHRRNTQQALTESIFLEYIRFQVSQSPPPAAASINRRVGTAERALRCQYPETAPLGAPGFQSWYWRSSRLGYGRPRPALTQLRVKTPKRVVVPLSVEQVAQFWKSFRTSRDLAIVGLMLLHGLRSCEVLALNREDVQFPDSQVRVQGKGKRVRVLPLARETVELLDHYMTLERPPRCGQALFVCLKGSARGNRMTPAGLRSLFRHHRETTNVTQANPHRFRHTFASDMIRAGISLPALMQLMGHANIQTTMVYVQLTPKDVWEQYTRAVAQHIRPVPSL
jgi:integrase